MIFTAVTLIQFIGIGLSIAAFTVAVVVIFTGKL